MPGVLHVLVANPARMRGSICRLGFSPLSAGEGRDLAGADLPAELWGGLGPRQGWLLLFIDPNQGAPEGPDALRILHVDALGSERQPPTDLGPVHDGVYSGFDYDYCRTADEVPRRWR